MDLTEEEIADIQKTLKRTRRGGWQGQSFTRLVDAINRIRGGTLTLEGWIVPDVCTYGDCIYDLGLQKFIT